MAIQASLLQKMKMNKSASIDQNKIKIICDQLCDNLDRLLSGFNLEYKQNPRFISLCCPIHGGDNTGALNLYHVGEDYRGNWKCRTHNCHDIFKGSIIGFIRGIISNRKYNWQKQGDQTASFKEALDMATSFLNISLKDIDVSNIDIEKSMFISKAKLLNNISHDSPSKIKRSQVIKNLQIPSPYFLSRSFSSNILEKYDIGDCVTPNKQMGNRAVVPIYSENHEHMIGCTGRSLFSQCPKCSLYHNTGPCPQNQDSWKYSKWKHSSGFKTQDCLYNFWYSKKFIKESGNVIIVESPGNVWRLEENKIYNSVAIFGSNLSDRHKIILDSSGAMNIIVIMDSDEAGKKARDQIDKKCSRIYNIQHIYINKNDIAEMTDEEIKDQIQNKIRINN